MQLRSPVNPDEMLELRAVNDISTAQLATLPAIMARLGASVLTSPQQLLGGLREAVGDVQDEYVLERMLMAHPTAPTGGGAPPRRPARRGVSHFPRRPVAGGQRRCTRCSPSPTAAACVPSG